MIAYVAVGAKHGDMCNIVTAFGCLPKDSGVLVVSDRYKDIAAASGYPIDVYAGDWFDLAGALRYAKQKYRRAVIASTFGSEFPIDKKRPSYQLDQWERMGAKGFSRAKLPIKSPAEILPKQERITLFLESESSPFPHSADLKKIIEEAYPGKVMIAEREKCFSRLLDQMATSRVCVFVESGPLHLSAASNTEVMAFVTDKPTHWHGSAFHPRMRFHCRYSDYESRKGEFMRTLARAYHGVSEPEYKEITGIFDGGYNPAMTEHDGKLLMAYRWHPKNDSLSQLAIAELAKDTLRVRRNSPISVPDELKEFSIEDARFFTFKGKLHISYTVARYPMPPFVCGVGYGELENKDGSWSLVSHQLPRYGQNDLQGMEKNWLFFERDNGLFAIYSPDTILKIEGDSATVAKKLTPEPKWQYGPIKGGCMVPFTDTDGNQMFLRFFHSRTDGTPNQTLWHYRIGAMLFDKAMNPLNVTPQPVIMCDEEWRDSRVWKPNVVFPAGAVVLESSPGKIKLLLAAGHNDSACRIYTITQDHLI